MFQGPSYKGARTIFWDLKRGPNLELPILRLESGPSFRKPAILCQAVLWRLFLLLLGS